MGNRIRVKVNDLTGDHVSAALRGDIVEVIRQGGTEAVLIRYPRSEQDEEQLVELIREMIANQPPPREKRRREKKTA